MDALRSIVPRDGTQSSTLTPVVTSLLIALLCLLVAGCGLLISLVVIRSNRRRREQQGQLPYHKSLSKSHLRRSKISATPLDRSSYSISFNEKESFLLHSSSPPSSPVPEIHITFPEEKDKAGKRYSNRVVVVQISDSGNVGLAPFEEPLPSYQTPDGDAWKSLDLEKLGGLKEKSYA